MNIEEIYYNFKEINLYKIYYKEKYHKRYIWLSLFIILIILSGATGFIFNVIPMYLILIAMGLITLKGIKLMNKIDRELSQIIKLKLNIKYEYKSIYTYFDVAKGKEFIQYLNDIGIKSDKQKDILSELFYKKYNETKVNNIWAFGVIAALSLPVWNKLIDIMLSKPVIKINDVISLIRKTGLIIVIIMAIIVCFRLSIYNDVIDIMNIKSKRYKKMYDLLQIHILNCDKDTITIRNILNNKNCITYESKVPLIKKK